MATTSSFTGYDFSTQEDIIKFEMEIGIRDVDCYVAPTFINLENPTFWTNQSNFASTKNNIFAEPQLYSDSENLLRKIIFVNNMSFKFDFLNEDFVDNLNPKLTFDVDIERMEGSFNGSEWWRFYEVIEQIVLSRGEKAAEVILIENRRSKEMKRMKTEFIRDIINSKLKNQYKE